MHSTSMQTTGMPKYPQWQLSLIVPRRYSHLSLNKCLFHVSVSLLFFFYQFTFMLFLYLIFELFGWLSAVYVVFLACSLFSQLLIFLGEYSTINLSFHTCTCIFYYASSCILSHVWPLISKNNLEKIQCIITAWFIYQN